MTQSNTAHSATRPFGSFFIHCPTPSVAAVRAEAERRFGSAFIVAQNLPGEPSSNACVEVPQTICDGVITPEWPGRPVIDQIGRA